MARPGKITAAHLHLLAVVSRSCARTAAAAAAVSPEVLSKALHG